MRRVLLLLCALLLLFMVPIYSETLPVYEPYEAHEFPLWTYKLRRAETLFFGSLVITLPVAGLVYTLAQNIDLVTAPSDDLQAFLVQGSIAASLSLGISLADYIIGEVGSQ